MIELNGEAQHKFQVATFGPLFRPKGIVDHIEKECQEILDKPEDPEEWVDVMVLAVGGLKHLGYSDVEISYMFAAKQVKNWGRNWPDWRTADPDKAIEHVRS
jgi:hypothetical protein